MRTAVVSLVLLSIAGAACTERNRVQAREPRPATDVRIPDPNAAVDVPRWAAATRRERKGIQFGNRQSFVIEAEVVPLVAMDFNEFNEVRMFDEDAGVFVEVTDNSNAKGNVLSFTFSQGPRGTTLGGCVVRVLSGHLKGRFVTAWPFEWSEHCSGRQCALYPVSERWPEGPVTFEIVEFRSK